jgi:hypothetical protein
LSFGHIGLRPAGWLGVLFVSLFAIFIFADLRRKQKPLTAEFAEKSREERREKHGERKSGLALARYSGSRGERQMLALCGLGRLHFGDDRRFRQHDPVSAFPLRAVERGISGLQQFSGRSAVLRKFGDTYGGCDHAQGLSLVYHR